MLDHHPQIACNGDSEYLVDFMHHPNDRPDIELYREWLTTNRIFQDHDFKIDPSLNYQELVTSFIAQFSEKSGKPVVGALVHRHFDRLLEFWPEARYIHLVRDGRDVANSCVVMGWSGNAWAAADIWETAEICWQKTKDLIPENNRYEVKMEELVQDPASVLMGICEFLGVPYSESMMSYPESATYGFPDPSLLYQWKRKMTAKQCQHVESKIGKMLEDRGYELSQTNTTHLSGSTRFCLICEDVAKRNLFRIKRYGWKLWFKEMLSRRFAILKLQKASQLEINDIVRKHVK
jgi:hypothetical protein